MKNIIILIIFSNLILTSCISKKQYTDLEGKYRSSQKNLNTATEKLNSCLTEKAATDARSEAQEERLNDLKKTNQDLIQSSKDLTMLTTVGATNLEKSLESLKEKDLKITRLQDAVSKKDSVLLALITSLKGEVGINDPDIQINVEKGVVYISIADKLLFKSGKYEVTDRAREVLTKVAKVVNSKPEFECMVEGHTDNVPYKDGLLLDNWDLSVKRSTSVIRVLQELKVNPAQLIASGRSFYVPLVENDTAENRAINRRTRIIVLPKLDQFYDMISKELKNLSGKENTVIETKK